jgi:hypothetical protein
MLAPIQFKHAVDALAAPAGAAAPSGAGAAAAAVAVGAAVRALLLAGGCRLLSGVAKEMQFPLFTPVAQARSALVWCIEWLG